MMVTPRSKPNAEAGACLAKRRAARGFTLVEIMVVVVIISVLAAVAVPSVIRVKRKAVATTVANDLRVFAAAFDTYAHEKGGWPAEAAAGVLPPEMVDRLEKTAWERVTPIGGHYNWDYKQTHGGVITAVIEISDTASAPVIQDVDLWVAVDRVMDDGNLNTGNFRIGGDGTPIFIIAP